MPRVPTYDEPKVKAAGLPGVRQSIGVSGEEFGVGVGQAQRQGGNDVVRTADIIIQRELKRKQEDDEDAVWNAYNQLSSEVRDYTYNPETGIYNKKGADALGVSGRAAKDIGSMAERISGTLTSENQKKLFNRLYSKRLDSELETASRFESAERQTYRDQTATGVTKSLAEDSKLNWNNPKLIGENADAAAAVISKRLREKGTAEEVISVEAASTRSGMWRSSIEAAAQANPIQAKALLDAHRDKLTGDDALALDKLIEVPLRGAKASAIAGQVTRPASTLPGDVSSGIAAEAAAQGVDASLALTIASIENAKGDPEARPRDKDGKLLSTAHGIFQFIDGTWKAVGGTAENRSDVKTQIKLGVKHIKENTEALRASLGREPTAAEVYLAHQQGLGGAKALLTGDGSRNAVSALTAVTGDAAKARAAIVNNGGNEGMTVNDFIGRWQRTYDKKAQRGSASSPSDLSLSEKLTAGLAMAGDDPELRKAVTAEITSQHGLQKAAKAADIDDAMEKVYDHVLRTGSYTGVDPKVLAKLDSKTLLELQSKTRNVKTDWAFYDEYMSKTPAEKAAVPLPQLMTRLGETELKAAIKERRDGKTGASSAPWLQARSSILLRFAKEAGILPEGDKVKPAENAQYNAYSEFMNRKMDEYREKNGREMPESEYRQEAARAVTNVTTLKDGKKAGDWFATEEKRVFELAGREGLSIGKLSDIPSTMRSEIEIELRKAGKRLDEKFILGIARSMTSGDPEAIRNTFAGVPLK